MKGGTVALLLVLALFIVSGLWVRQCQSTKEKDDIISNMSVSIDTLKKNFTQSQLQVRDYKEKYTSKLLDEKTAENYALGLSNTLQKAFGVVNTTVAQNNALQNRQLALENLIANKSLAPEDKPSAEAVADTSKDISANKKLVDAVAKTSLWLKIYQDSIPKLISAVGTYKTKADNNEQLTLQAVNSSLYAEGKLRILSNKKSLSTLFKSRRVYAGHAAEAVHQKRETGLVDPPLEDKLKDGF